MRALSRAVLICMLSGCVVTPETRTAVYHPDEYMPYARLGTGKITGQAFLKTVGGDVKYGAGNTVALHPVTSLTNEWFAKVVIQGRPIVAGNPHADDYRRTSTADTRKADLNSIICLLATSTLRAASLGVSQVNLAFNRLAESLTQK